MPSPQTIKVAIAGINGRMGRASVHAIASEVDMEIVGAFGKEGAPYVGKSLQELIGLSFPSKTDILVSNGFSDCVTRSSPDVILDFTEAQSSYQYGMAALGKKIRPVLGTSGIPLEHLEKLKQASVQEKTGALVVPNFSLGAIFMINAARRAAEVFDNVEIVETHNLGKKDAPSGTAMHTAREIEKSNKTFNKSSTGEVELLAGARGGQMPNGVRVHSLRLPGVLSLQEVIFGSDGELLTIRHDSFNTNCFARGILLAVRSVIHLDSLVIGLERFMLKNST
jgi:4-hydroxy-tetrahydrodipicolinate reductase